MPAERRKRKDTSLDTDSPALPSKKTKQQDGSLETATGVLENTANGGASLVVTTDGDTVQEACSSPRTGHETSASVVDGNDTTLTWSSSEDSNTNTCNSVAKDVAANQSTNTVFLADLTEGPKACQEDRADRVLGNASGAAATSNCKVAYSARLLERIDTFVGFADEAENTYALVSLPTHTDWGTRRAGEDLSDTLCRASSNRPITLWVVGRIRQIYFKDRSGTPYNQVAVHIEPFGDNTLALAGALLRKLSRPQEQGIEDSYGDVRASRWQTSNLAGYRNAPAPPFEDIYDAREAFTDKADMRLYDPDSLKHDDVVLLEMSIGRYRLKEDAEQSPKKGKNVPGWSKYKATFNLKSVSLLYDAPFEARPVKQVKKIGIVI